MYYIVLFKALPRIIYVQQYCGLYYGLWSKEIGLCSNGALEKPQRNRAGSLQTASCEHTGVGMLPYVIAHKLPILIWLVVLSASPIPNRWLGLASSPTSLSASAGNGITP